MLLLSAIDLSRLITTLRNQRYSDNQFIYKMGLVTNQVLLIESGHATIYTKEDMSEKTPAEVDDILGIIRPKSKRKSVAKMNDAQLERFMAVKNILKMRVLVH